MGRLEKQSTDFRQNTCYFGDRGGTALTGGTGGAVNTVIGALVLGVMENGMNVVGIDAYFQQSIFGIVIIVSVALTFDRSKTSTIK